MRPLRRTPPTVSYDIKAIQRPLAGKPYLGFVCDSCKGQIAMLDAQRTTAKSALPCAQFEVQCPHCGVLVHKGSDAMLPFVA